MAYTPQNSQPNTQTEAQTTTQASATQTSAHQSTQPALTDMLSQEQLDKAAYYMRHGIIPETYEGNPINGLETFLKRAEKHEQDYNELCDNPDLLRKVFKKNRIECPKFDLFPASLPSYGFGEVFYPTIGANGCELSIDGTTYEEDFSIRHTVSYKKLKTSIVFHDGKHGSHIMPLIESISQPSWDFYLNLLVCHYEILKKFIKDNSHPIINLNSGGDFPLYDTANSMLKGIFSFRNITLTIPQFDEPRCLLEILSLTRKRVNAVYDELAEENTKILYRTWNTQKKVFLMAASGAALTYALFPFPSVFDTLFYLVGYFAVLHGIYPLASSYALRRRTQEFSKNAEAVEKIALSSSSSKGFKDFDKLMRLLVRIHPKDAQELSEEITQGATLKTLADVVDEKAKVDWRYKVIAKQMEAHKCTKDEQTEGNHAENGFDSSLN